MPFRGAALRVAGGARGHTLRRGAARRQDHRPAVPGVRPGLRAAARATARSTRSSSRPTHEVELGDRGTITNFTIITPVQYPGQKETEPFARCSSCSTAPTACLSSRTCSTSRSTTCASACASPPCGPPRSATSTSSTTGGWGSAEGGIVGWMPTGEPDVDADASFVDSGFSDADRRRRSRSSGARRSPSVREHRHHRDAAPARGHHRRARATPASTARDIGFTCAGSCDYLAGPGVRVRAEPRRHRRVAADLASRTSRWTARGRCTRRGSGCSTATSTSRSCSARASRRRATRRRSTRCRSTRTTSRRSALDPVSLAALQARALLDAGKATERDIAEVVGPQPRATRWATRTRR